MRSGSTAAIVGLAICLPCLALLLIVAGVGAGAFTAIGPWFSGNGLVLVGAAAAAAVPFAALAGIIYARGSRAASCASDAQLLPRAGDKRTWRGQT